MINIKAGLEAFIRKERKMKKSIMQKYAYLVAKVGVNVQPNQEVIINANIDQAEFVSYVVTECYKLKASHVTIEWSMPPAIRKTIVKYEAVEKLAEVPNWQIEKLKHRVKTNPVIINIMSSAPDALKGLDMGKLNQASMMTYPIVKPFIDEMNNQYQWTIVAVPSVEWAQKVFPNLSKKQAVEALWNAILKTARVTNDPIEAWNQHNQDLLNRCNYLNNLEIDFLEYHAGNGTNFKVWMLEQCQWLGGGETSLRGIYFNPNIPTEECFITPMKGKAEGYVVATKPLSYNGNLIENFTLTFKDGKVVAYTAEVGEKLLGQMLSMDEGASYLGECALVPYESPVNQTGILFYNTLFDENATCHLALGRGFSDCVKNYEKYSPQEFEQMGINSSMIHVDFMIGAADLTIDAHLKDGTVVPIFVNGTWAFKN